MGSRIRENPERVFELFVEIARPHSADQDPFVLQQYPADFKDEDVVRSIPKFAFPCDTESNVVEHFTFVLTDTESKFKFCFCRHGTTGAQTCLCIVSHFPWFEIYYRLLNHLAEVTNRTEYCTVEPLLHALYSQKAPEPLDTVETVTPTLTDHFSFIAPDINQLCTIPESRNLTEYYNAVDTNNMMVMFASMLMERRVLITSRKLSRLTACVHGSAALLYPMHWQHLYIPILPPHLVDYCSAPMPYLIGIHATLMEKAQSNQELGDAVILDCDANTVTSEYDDLGSLPPEVVNILKKHLKSPQSEKTRMNLMGDGLARAFLRALVALIGGYRDALKFRTGQQITFSPEAFILSRPPSMQPFLEKMLQLQIFEQFINERLDLLNTGLGFKDVFEDEANIWSDKSGTQTKYREWVGQMKKQGKKLRREGKDKWSEFTSRANPAMRQAIYTFRDKSKKTFKDLRSRIDDLRKDEEEGESPPHGIPIGGTALQRARHSDADGPARPPPPDLEHRLAISPQRQQSLRRRSYENALVGNRLSPQPGTRGGRQYRVLDVDLEDPGPYMSRRLQSDELSMRHSRRLASDDSDIINKPYERVSVGLMDDPEIQQVFKRSFSMEDLDRLREDQDDYVEVGFLDHSLDAAQDTVFVGDLIMLNDQVVDNGSSSPSVSTSGLRVPRDSLESSGSSSPARGPSPIARPRPSTPGSISQGSTHSSGAGDILPLPKPAPAKRRSTGSPSPLLTATPPTAENLIKLDDGSSSTPAQRKSSDTIVPNIRMHKRSDSNSEFDPLKKGSCASEESLGSSVSSMSRGSEDSEENREITRRPSLSRHNAFYNVNRPPSVKRKNSSQAKEATAIQDARKQFIASHTTQPSLSNELDQFDPLLTGQLAIDSVPFSGFAGSSVSVSSSNSDSQEENLLKEWNLDFGKHRVAADRSPAPAISARPQPPCRPPPPIAPKPDVCPRSSLAAPLVPFPASHQATSSIPPPRPAPVQLTSPRGSAVSITRGTPSSMRQLSASGLRSPQPGMSNLSPMPYRPPMGYSSPTPLPPTPIHASMGGSSVPGSTYQASHEDAARLFNNYNQPSNRNTLPASLAYLPQPYHAPMGIIQLSSKSPQAPPRTHRKPTTLNNNDIAKDPYGLLQLQTSANQNTMNSQPITNRQQTVSANPVVPVNKAVHKPTSPKAMWEQFD